MAVKQFDIDNFRVVSLTTDDLYDKLDYIAPLHANLRSLYEDDYFLKISSIFLEDYILDIIRLCFEAELEIEKDAHQNMETDDWWLKPYTLLYLMHKTDKFHAGKGMFNILYDMTPQTDSNGDKFISNRVIACSGIYKSDFDPNVAIGGVRTWIVPEYRTKYLVSKYITPIQFDWCKEHDISVFALTFNEYNKRLMHILNRSGDYSKQRKSHIMGVKRLLRLGW